MNMEDRVSTLEEEVHGREGLQCVCARLETSMESIVTLLKTLLRVIAWGGGAVGVCIIAAVMKIILK